MKGTPKSGDENRRSGRTVTLSRHQELMGPHELFQPPTPSDYWFEFTNPDTGQTVRWESDQDLATRSLSINQMIPELLTVPVSNGVFRYKCPDPPYLAFQFVDGKWTAVPFTRIAHRTFAQNMSSLFADIEPVLARHRYDLTTADIDDALPPEFRGKVIDLTSVGEQTLGMHCFPTFNWMLRDALAKPEFQHRPQKSKNIHPEHSLEYIGPGSIRTARPR